MLMFNSKIALDYFDVNVTFCCVKCMKMKPYLIEILVQPTNVMFFWHCLCFCLFVC